MPERRSSKPSVPRARARDEELLRALRARAVLLCGIDEAGRGPLAGPVTAAAVVLTPDFPIRMLADSKKLSERVRIEAASVIMERSLAYGIGWAWPEEIDRLNILRASLVAMARAHVEAVRRLSAGHVVVVDGPYSPEVAAECHAIVGGDGFVPEIQAASILAKTARDRWMTRYAWIDDRYGYERHKGYPTAEHRALCLRHGPSPIQRMSFRVRAAIDGDETA